MRTPVGLVTAALTAAILVTATLVIATGTRGEETEFPSSAGGLEVRTFARAWSIHGRWHGCPMAGCW
jgi:hypothetical protein